MLWVRSTHCKLFEMILTSSDPTGLERKSLEKDKLCEEASRLAWMDLEVLMEAWTKGCIEMSEIIISLLSFLKIQLLMPLPSVWVRSSGRPSVWERERERVLACHKDSLLALSSPHQTLSDPNCALVFTWTLITLFSWSWPHEKQMSMSHKGENQFSKRNYNIGAANVLT